MPLYEYQCSKLHITELFFHSISEGDKIPETKCVICGLNAEKIISKQSNPIFVDQYVRDSNKFGKK